MKTYLLTFILLLCAWFGVGTAQAAFADSVVAWGVNYSGQTTVPFDAQ